MSDATNPTGVEGIPASEGIASGNALRVAWSLPEIPTATISGAEARGRELRRLRDALDWAANRLESLKQRTARRLGDVEARIFDPQLLMLDDPELVEGVRQLIARHRLPAARAFELRMLELKELWSRTSHPMVLDRLNDLRDLRLRVLRRLLKLPSRWIDDGADNVVVVARNLTPSFVARLQPGTVVAVATDEGSRTSHWAILARSLQIPAVVGLGNVRDRTRNGTPIIVDGAAGRVVIDPDATENARYVRRRSVLLDRPPLPRSPDQPPANRKQRGVVLRANLDLPGDAVRAMERGAEGIGLFRSEFLMVGRRAMPEEDEQYDIYSSVCECFPSHPVLIRTFDLGGDKFPIFLRAPLEENPLLGRRGVRVCADEPGLFLIQLRAILRAAVHGDIRIMAPMVNTVDEIGLVRNLLTQAQEQLRRRGVPFSAKVQLGAMIETPAAALDAPALARHADFLSIGTNDLVQYTLAIDRANAKLAPLYDPLHPAILRLVSMVAQAGRDAGTEVSACGELAARPAGAILMAGLGVKALSVAWTSLSEIRDLLGRHPIEDIRAAAAAALDAGTSAGVREVLAQILCSHKSGRLS